jgi:PD-(D/E)XK nuclease superfamily protein
MDDNRSEGKLKVSQSKVRQWRECRRKFWYAHVMKIQRKRAPRPLAFGTISHKMKETLAQGGDPFKVLEEIPRQDLDIYESDFEKYGDIVQDLRYIYEAYLAYWRDEPLVYLSHEGRRAEHPFEVDVGDGILVKGTIDAVTKYRQMNWLTEHKNHGNIPNDDERWRNLQSVVYIKILRKLNWWKNIEGTCWDYIRSKPPTRPALLKNGDISTRRIDTLPNVVQQVLKKYRGRPGYKSLVDSAMLNMPTYFQRIYTPIKNQVIEQVWHDFITTAKEMRDTDLLQPQVRTIARHCIWCQFEPLCRASLTGGDEEYLIEHDYTASTYGERNEEALTE